MTDLEFVEGCRQFKVRPAIMLDAFDELVQSARLATPLTATVVTVLQSLQVTLKVTIVVSSRFKERNTLQALSLHRNSS